MKPDTYRLFSMKKILQILGRYRADLLVWAAFIAYETVLLWLVLGVSGAPAAYAVHFALTIICFYVTSLIALPWVFQHHANAWWKVALVFISYLPAYVVMHFAGELFLGLTGVTSFNRIRLDQQYLLRNMYRGTFFFGLAVGYYFLSAFIREQQEREKLREAHYKALLRKQEAEKRLVDIQNAYMKAQINPHFLFNTLDFVYHNMNLRTEDAAEAILILSRLMRYAIASAQTESVPLRQELDQVRQLITLYALRKPGNIQIDLRYDPATAGLPFIPLVLITLTENMVKHGTMSREGAVLRLTVLNGDLFIESRNLSSSVPVPGTGTGLENLRNRLHHAYGTRAAFQTFTDATGHFNVQITVPLLSLHVHAPSATPLKGIDR
ncbi:sensor histidine kinase [Pedobacter sp. SYP-B3415]|uniref:sensor histidine kinase n=1 Tax=Pedobacter sp. SYP-B3415 TaxID=2496641 RepID=UPI0013ECF11D|nr:histidine kinase [Pedobacter sp. SYP-B3415]